MIQPVRGRIRTANCQPGNPRRLGLPREGSLANRIRPASPRGGGTGLVRRSPLRGSETTEDWCAELPKEAGARTGWFGSESRRISVRTPLRTAMAVSSRLEKFLTGPDSDPSVRARYLDRGRGAVPPGPQGPEGPEIHRPYGVGGRPPPGSVSRWALGDPGRLGRGALSTEVFVTNWRATVLADLGMTRTDPRIRRTAELILKKWGEKELVRRGAEHCITGNAARTLIRFGYFDHPVVQKCLAWLVRTQKSDGGWHCFRSRTGTLDCWEGLAAMAEVPEEARDGPGPSVH